MIAVLAGGARRVVLQVPGETLRNPIYSQTGHLLYERETTNPGIWAVPFSLDRLETTGPPILVVPGGSASEPGPRRHALLRPRDEAPVDSCASRGRAQSKSSRACRDEHVDGGSVARTAPAIGRRAGLSLSPDGTRLAVSLGAHPGSLLVYDLDGAPSRAWPRALCGTPVWNPGGERLIYGSARGARAWNLWSRRADGAGEEQRLSKSEKSRSRWPYHRMDRPRLL